MITFIDWFILKNYLLRQFIVSRQTVLVVPKPFSVIFLHWFRRRAGLKAAAAAAFDTADLPRASERLFWFRWVRAPSTLWWMSSFDYFHQQINDTFCDSTPLRFSTANGVDGCWYNKTECRPSIYYTSGIGIVSTLACLGVWLSRAGAISYKSLSYILCWYGELRNTKSMIGCRVLTDKI